MIDDVSGRCFTHITGVFLECKSEDENFLVGDGVEHAGDHVASKARLLVVVHLDNSRPVISNFSQSKAAADVHKVENILLEARPTKSHGGAKELRADTGVGTDRTRYLFNISPSLFAKCRNGIDRRNALRQKCVGRQLRELTRPQVGGEDALFGDPLAVDVHNSLHCRAAGRGFLTTDEHTGRLQKVANCSSLCQKLWVGQNLVGDTWIDSSKDTFDGLCGVNRDGRFFHDDLGRCGGTPDVTSNELQILEVGCHSCSCAVALCWRINANKDDICGRNF
mmetsp:Transcript_46965/g.69528  ORF Transcript_46965/g.69528 Transcript_46965/m.69528 type:complete len:279 (-) Transcript_46965:295-1131(-)